MTQRPGHEPLTTTPRTREPSEAVVVISRRPSVWRRIRRSRFATIGLGILVVEAIIALIGPLVAPFDPSLPSVGPPLLTPTSVYLMGTDDLGRDILSRVLHGGRLAFLEGLVVVTFSMGVGVTFGALAGYYGRLDAVLGRIAEVLLAYPGLLLAIAIVAVIGPGLTGALVAVSIGGIAPTALLTRALVRSLANNDYVMAARQVGCRDRRVLLQHILPNAMSPLLVQATFRVAIAILSVSGLSFLGLGAQPPTPEWGAMLSSGRDLILISPHVAAFPGVAIAITVLGFNLLGDGLRDVYDPRSLEAQI